MKLHQALSLILVCSLVAAMYAMPKEPKPDPMQPLMATNVQSVVLASQQSQATWTGTINQSASTPSSVVIEVTGRNAWSLAVTDTGTHPCDITFTETQHLTATFANSFNDDMDGDTVNDTMTVQPSATVTHSGEAALGSTITITDPTTLALFTGSGTVGVRVVWDVSPSLTSTNGNHMDVQTAAFSGRCVITYN